MPRMRRNASAAVTSVSGETRAVVKVSGTGDAIAILPYLFGFAPHESLVVVAIEGPRRRFGPCFRMDLVSHQADVPSQIDYTQALVRHHSYRRVMVFALSEHVELANTVLDAVVRRLRASDVEVLEAVRADGAHWWSMTCRDPLCCQPEGTPYDVETSRVAAEAVLAGLPRAPDREALRAVVAPVDGMRRERIRAAVAQANAVPVISDLVSAALVAPRNLSEKHLAALAVAVQEVGVRDQAWALMSRETAPQHFQLWRTVMQVVPDELLSPVGSLAAFAAWLSGNGVLASHAAERVLSVDPGYSMARLVIAALESCLHPDTWEGPRVG